MPKIVMEEETEEEVELDIAPDEEDEEVEPGIVMPEDLPPETPLFEGGPTAGDIIEWKKEFGDVYVTEISFENYVVWRTINRGEYKKLVKQVNDMVESAKYSEVDINMYNEEAICSNCILFPVLDSFEKELAGMPAVISQQILESSGFKPWDTRGL